MLSMIFSIGPITIWSLGFLMAVGVFLESFIIWRRLRDLGLKEEKILDFIIVALLWGFLISRLLFILQHFNQFGFHLNRWFLFIRYPGFSFWGWLLGMIATIYWFVKKEKWNFWRIADEVAFGILPFLSLIQFGRFLDGSGFGRSTSMPWGFYFPGTLLKRHPVSLFSAIFIFLIWFLLLRVERYWRTWAWYKDKGGGFIGLVALGLIFLTHIPLAIIKDSKIYFYWSEIGLMIIAFLAIATLFYIRSGRNLKNFLLKRRIYEKEED